MLNYLEREFKRSGEEGPAKIMNGLLTILGKDIPFPSSEQTLSLEQATREYKNKPTNPELLTQFMRSFWAETSQKIGKSIVVDKFPLTSKEIREEREKRGRMAIFVPAEVSRVDLGRMFPKMESLTVQEGNLVVDIVNNFGWLWIETSVDAPNRNTTESQLAEKFKKEGRVGQSLKTNIIGSQISKLLVGEYFDQGPTYSRLPGSCGGGRVLRAFFVSGGNLIVNSDLDPESCNEFFGGRSEEVIKA